MKKVACILVVFLLLSACGEMKDSSAGAPEETPDEAQAAAKTRQEELDKALLDAVKNSDRDKLKEMIAKGADPNSLRWCRGATLLHLAGDKDIIKALVKAGADINARDRDGYTPLDWACASHDYCRKDLLLELGAEPGEGYEILSVGHNMTKIREMLDRGADINTVDRKDYSVLHNYVLSSASLMNSKYLEPDLKSSIKQFELASIRELVERGANPNTTSRSGWEAGRTPLHDIASMNVVEIAEILLDANADLEAHDRYYHNTPLIFAVEYGCREMTGFLLDRGADVSARDSSGRTALHLTAKEASNTYCRDNKEEYESRMGDIAQFLLSWQADVNARDREGKTPLDYAETENMKRLLRSYGAKTGKELEEEDK